MFHSLKLGALAVALVTLVACEPVDNPNTLPGMLLADAGTAAGLFRSVCVRNKNDLDSVPVVLSTMNIERDPSSDIYYHQTYDLSFKIFKRDGFSVCSMVWRPDSSQAANQAAISAVSPGSVVRPPNNGLSGTSLVGRS